MTTVANASVVFKDKNGNVGTVKGASVNDVTKIRTAISDVAQVVNPTTHLPINATTSSVGVVQLADSAAVAAGTAGRIIDAAQLKNAIDNIDISNMATTDTAQTISGVKTFTALPQSSVVPTADNQLVNKAYVDTKGNTDLTVASTYAEPAVENGVLFPATNLITPPGSGHTLEDRGAKTGEIKLYAGPTVPSGYLLCNGAAVSRTTYADLFEIIGTTYGVGDGSSTFNLPDLRDRYPIGAGTNTLGTMLAEQLPNVYGHFRSRPYDGTNETSGAFRRATSDNTYVQALGSISVPLSTHIIFSAQYYSSIYTSNGSVRPLSLVLNYIIKG